MAPKGKQTSTEMRQLVIKLNLDGKSIRDIGKIVDRSPATIHGIIRRYRDECRVENKSRQGQGRILNDHEERRLMKEVKKNPLQTARELRNKVERDTGKKVCAETVRNVLRKNDYNGRIIRKKPFISPKNRIIRKSFCKEYLIKDSTFWNTVKGI